MSEQSIIDPTSTDLEYYIRVNGVPISYFSSRFRVILGTNGLSGVTSSFRSLFRCRLGMSSLSVSAFRRRKSWRIDMTSTQSMTSLLCGEDLGVERKRGLGITGEDKRVGDAECVRNASVGEVVQ